ncbi:HTH-type transcriptional regulator CysB [Vibrio sp. SS-MA-C1-2]|uniref:HTH-type transcriptional regulator CysB n=1 Tax=Vibrio sp. SS-MA-C1-2 TaxID=2908646 RepID=UPI001F2B0B5B|nr:HTH-type transcriptional regulator CysB [Vibrio sp. SS-MA-C1-2]UJF19836.1 HTH-type transcriptional regulator CysB [Vibrio sp. SS-MA-C1-2]
MKLQQLRYIVEVSNNKLNVSTTAEHLFTSQPGISKQIKILEDELGIEIFMRTGKHLTEVTASGEKVIQLAREVLAKVDSIKRVAEEEVAPEQGELSISTTHTQARYALPETIKVFKAKYPDVRLNMHQGTTKQILDSVTKGRVQFAIATEIIDNSQEIMMLPCYQWRRSLVVTKNHPLAKKKRITLTDLANYPLITYAFSIESSQGLNRIFKDKGLEPNLAFTATDAEVIKTYVKLGVGIGLIANMAVNDDHHGELVFIDTSHIIPPSTTYLYFRRGTYLRSYMYEFIFQFAPHLTKNQIEKVMLARDCSEAMEIFSSLNLPLR